MDYSDINIIRLEEDEKIETKFTPTVNHHFTKEDLVINSRVTSMSVNLDLPNSFDYKEEYYKNTWKNYNSDYITNGILI